jgi:hypothetical protein
MCGSFSGNFSGSLLARFTYNFTLQSSGQWQYVTYTVPPPPNIGAITTTNGGGIIVDIMSFYIGYITSVPGTWETGAAMYNFGSTAAVANPWWNNAGNYIEFTGVQLEKGTVATPFEFRPYATELQLCQRYCWTLNTNASSGNTNYGVAAGQGTTSLRFYLQTPVAMRDPYNIFLTTKSGSVNLRTGSLTISNGELSVYNGSTSIGVTSVANADWGYSNPTIIGFVLTVASGMTQGQAWIVYTQAYTSYFILSCEL